MDATPLIRTLAQQVESARLALHTAALPAPRYRPLNTAGIRDALRYLRDTLRTYGWQVVDQPCSDPLLGSGTNLVATLPGQTRPELLVVIGAHHDTAQGSPGADDNGSGLAGLLELGRLLGRRRWEASIQLVAFDFAESGCSGSRAYVEALRARGDELRAALIFEAIGYSTRQPGSQALPAGLEQRFPDVAEQLDQLGRRGNFLAALGSERHSALLEHVAQWAVVAAPDLPLVRLPLSVGSPLRELFQGDHIPFWEAGLPAVMLTDTAALRNPHYHQPSDLPGTLDPAFWRRVVMATVATVAALVAPLA